MVYHFTIAILMATGLFLPLRPVPAPANCQASNADFASLDFQADCCRGVFDPGSAEFSWRLGFPAGGNARLHARFSGHETSLSLTVNQKNMPLIRILMETGQRKACLIGKTGKRQLFFCAAGA